MKISCALLATVALAENKKVPPRHPLQRLQRLTEFSEELLNEWYDLTKSFSLSKFMDNERFLFQKRIIFKPHAVEGLPYSFWFN